MAFCNSCGNNLAPGAQFCNKCGTAVLASVPAPASVAAPVPPAPSSGGSGALKIILIVVAVVVGLGILGVAVVGIGIWKVAHSARVHHNGDNVKIETPIGSIESSKDPATTAKELGVDIYPGATMVKGSSASATVFGIHTASAAFESPDSLEQVSAFYKSKMPNASITSCEENHCSIVANDQKTTTTISMETHESGTRIQITNVTGKPNTNSSSN